MVYEEVNQKQEVDIESKGVLSEIGIITETFKRFQGSLIWMNHTNLN
jgi:hypothetical protein